MHKPEELFDKAKDHLMRAKHTSRHPFRFCHLVTFDTASQSPESRMVVCREIDSDLSITIFTDSRSPKVRQLIDHHVASVVFWHPKQHLQVRLKGICTVHSEGSDLYEEYINQVRQSPNVSDYSSPVPPGTVSDLSPKVNEPEDLHFAVIKFTTESADVLELSREGHKRIRASRQNSHWKIEELVP